MSTHAQPSPAAKTTATPAKQAQSESVNSPSVEFSDQRAEATTQRKSKTLLQDNWRVKQLKAVQEMADNYTSTVSTPFQLKQNQTGLPNGLKHGIEQLSGYGMDDVRVHFNSSKPAQLQAHAFAQGTTIHIGPGQEKHLPHEAWHVVQQKQGRVRPTLQLKGKIPVNDDAGLEREADFMGAKAMQMIAKSSLTESLKQTPLPTSLGVVQGEWATADTRAQIPGGRSGHHIIAKDDLTDVRAWAVEDYGKDHSKNNAQQLFQTFPNAKALWNVKYNIVVGPSDYTNNPANSDDSQFDPSTEREDVDDHDETHMGMSSAAMDTFGLEKRVLSNQSQIMLPLQNLIDKRKSDQAPWTNEEWGVALDALTQGGQDQVHAMDADEWAPDTALRGGITPDGAQIQTDGDAVVVDGNYIRVQDGKLSMGGQPVPTATPAADVAGKLQVGGRAVTLGDGKLKIGDEDLRAWKPTPYRKRPGFVMLNPQGGGAGQSIFDIAAQRNRKSQQNPKDHIGFDSVNGQHYKIKTSYNLGHILLRHSLQWWGGGTTSKNIFFPLPMTDKAIFIWCKDKVETFRENTVMAKLIARKEEIKAQEAEQGYSEDYSIEDRVKGNMDGMYIDASIKGDFDEQDKWEVTVKIETMAPNEGFGIQIPQGVLKTFIQAHPHLPLVLQQDDGDDGDGDADAGGGGNA